MPHLKPSAPASHSDTSSSTPVATYTLPRGTLEVPFRKNRNIPENAIHMPFILVTA